MWDTVDRIHHRIVGSASHLKQVGSSSRDEASSELRYFIIILSEYRDRWISRYCGTNKESDKIRSETMFENLKRGQTWQCVRPSAGINIVSFVSKSQRMKQASFAVNVGQVQDIAHANIIVRSRQRRQLRGISKLAQPCKERPCRKNRKHWSIRPAFFGRRTWMRVGYIATVVYFGVEPKVPEGPLGRTSTQPRHPGLPAQISGTEHLIICSL